MKKLVLTTLIAALTSLPLTAPAAGTLTLAKSATYHKDLEVRENIKTECKLGQNVMVLIENFAKQHYDKTVIVDKFNPNTKGHALDVTIVNVEAAGGGHWTGRKSVTIEGRLYNNGKAQSSFRAMRQTKGSYKTCASIFHINRAIGKDVANWLKDPVKDARLGDLK